MARTLTTAAFVDSSNIHLPISFPVDETLLEEGESECQVEMRAIRFQNSVRNLQIHSVICSRKNNHLYVYPNHVAYTLDNARLANGIASSLKKVNAIDLLEENIDPVIRFNADASRFHFTLHLPRGMHLFSTRLDILQRIGYTDEQIMTMEQVFKMTNGRIDDRVRDGFVVYNRTAALRVHSGYGNCSAAESRPCAGVAAPPPNEKATHGDFLFGFMREEMELNAVTYGLRFSEYTTIHSAKDKVNGVVTKCLYDCNVPVSTIEVKTKTARPSSNSGSIEFKTIDPFRPYIIDIYHRWEGEPSFCWGYNGRGRNSLKQKRTGVLRDIVFNHPIPEDPLLGDLNSYPLAVTGVTSSPSHVENGVFLGELSRPSHCKLKACEGAKLTLKRSFAGCVENIRLRFMDCAGNPIKDACYLKRDYLNIELDYVRSD